VVAGDCTACGILSALSGRKKIRGENNKQSRCLLYFNKVSLGVLHASLDGWPAALGFHELDLGHNKLHGM
jgi:hypothetical protein